MSQHAPLATPAGTRPHHVCVAGLYLCVFSHRIIELNGGQSPLTYKRFQTLISRMEAVEVPAESITAEIMGKCTTPLSDDHDDKFGVPSLEELGE